MFPVLGPVDVIGESGAGILHENLAVACIRALDIPRDKARHYAEQFSWGKSIDQFVLNLTPATVARRGSPGRAGELAERNRTIYAISQA